MPGFKSWASVKTEQIPQHNTASAADNVKSSKSAPCAQPVPAVNGPVSLPVNGCNDGNESRITSLSEIKPAKASNKKIKTQSSEASVSREKVALDESGTTKQNQFPQKNHVVNANRTILLNDINDRDEAGTMMATPKTGGRRASRKFKREKAVTNQVVTTPKSAQSTKDVQLLNNNDTDAEKILNNKETNEKRSPRDKQGEVATLPPLQAKLKTEVNIPEIVRKLQQAANAKKLQEQNKQFCTVPINPCGIIGPSIVHSVISATHQPPPPPAYRALSQPAIQAAPIIAPVQVHPKKIPAYVHNVHANRSDNWSTTPTSTSTSISTYNNQKFKKFMKKNKCQSTPNISTREKTVNHLLPEYMSEIGYELETGKTPISKLNELMQKRMLPLPTYDEGVGATGPPFIIFCRSKEMNLVTEGRGNSKKEGKHKAATQMLKLIKKQDADKEYKEEKRTIIDLTKLDLDELGNPVGFLQEFLQKRGSTLPIYNLGNEITSPFSCSATLPSDGQSANGFGNKKSEAKMNAALRMLHVLREEMLLKNITGCPPIYSTTTSPSSASEPGRIGSNIQMVRHPVTQLQEYCQKRKIFAPLYHYYQQISESVSTEIEYSCVCRITTYNLEVRETKRNQKEARKAAANQMLILLSRTTQHQESYIL